MFPAASSLKYWTSPASKAWINPAGFPSFTFPGFEPRSAWYSVLKIPRFEVSVYPSGFAINSDMKDLCIANFLPSSSFGPLRNKPSMLSATGITVCFV